MTKFAVLFDLDGTLIDSRRDIAAAVNAMRGHFGLDALPLETVVGHVGDGVIKLVERSIAGSAVDLRAALEVMQRCYAQNLDRHTILYPGVADGLAELKRCGVKLGVVTNKPEFAARAVLANLGVAPLFDGLVGALGEYPLKPSPAGCVALLERFGVEPANGAMVGDHYTDLAAGAGAGIHVVWARWGFGEPKNESYDFAADSFAALLTHLKQRWSVK